MQQYRNNRNNGNIYDLRKDLQHTPPPSQQKGSSGSADGRYGFNGEPLSFAPDRTANGTVRRTRTDNSIEFPSQPRRTEQSGTRRTSGQNRNRTAQRSRTAQPEQRASGTARKPQQRRSQGQKPRKTAAQAAQQRYKNQRLRPAVLSQGVTHFYEPLDAERMQRAAQCLIGENDFTSFRAVQCQSRTPWRNVMHINVSRFGAYVVVDIKANAFVHHMVRNIVGSLMEVGAHNQPESWIAELLAAKDRTLAAATAKAEGLYLVSVDYPAHYDLPVLPMGPLFLAD